MIFRLVDDVQQLLDLQSFPIMWLHFKSYIPKHTSYAILECRDGGTVCKITLCVTGCWAPTMGFSEHVRMLAAQLYKQNNFNAAEAGKKLTSLVEGEVPSDPGRFCKRWWSHFEENKHVKDKPRKGRPRKVPDSLAAELARKIMGNQDVTAVPTDHNNLRKVLEHDPEVAQQVVALAASQQTINRAIRRADPSIGLRRFGTKKQIKK